MPVKLFKTRTFDSLQEFLDWIDRTREQTAIINIVGASSYTVTYAEVSPSQVRVSGTLNLSGMNGQSIRVMD